jgi:hypothetical protein
VAALTAVALAVVGFFAYQASASQDRTKAGSSDASGSTSKEASGRERKAKLTTLPAFSGAGERVVYDLGRNRVWLMGKNQTVKRTFRVVPSSVDPDPGTYKVESRAAHVTGSDGVPVENVIRFARSQGTAIGFSAALDGSLPDTGQAGKKTGGIREHSADGEAMWLFATIGTKVVVVR